MKRLLTILLIFALGLQPALEGIAIDTDVAQFSLSTAFTAQAKSKKKKSKKNKKKSNKKNKQAKKDKGKQGKKGNNAAASKSNTPAPTPLIGNTSQQGTAGRNSDLVKVNIPRGMVNQTVRYKAITVYFNKQLHIPNCVAYELTATEIAQADAPDSQKRNNYTFNADPKVSSCPEWWEYKDSYYDRSHMAPAMDMRWSAKSMEQCFYMTNICPQDHDLNNGEWRKMEEAIHSWARTYKQIYVMTGPVLPKNNIEMTGKHNDIAVPQQFYKIVYAPQQGMAIAFLFDNENATNSWRNHSTTIDEVERLTGIDFFAALPDSTEDAVEAQNQFKKWPYHRDREFNDGYNYNNTRNRKRTH